MIDDRTDGYLDEVKAFAERAGKTEQLQKQLDYLANYSQSETRCLLFRDFAPMSFYFEIQRRSDAATLERWFNGGLIFFNKGDTGVGSPQFSVRAGDSLPCGWSVHT